MYLSVLPVATPLYAQDQEGRIPKAFAWIIEMNQTVTFKKEPNQIQFKFTLVMVL